MALTDNQRNYITKLREGIFNDRYKRTAQKPGAGDFGQDRRSDETPSPSPLPGQGKPIPQQKARNDPGYKPDQIEQELGKAEGDIAREISAQRAQSKLDKVSKILDEDFPHEEDGLTEKTPSESRSDTVSVQGARPISQKQYNTSP
jgi:hypothetical protein